MKSNNVSKENIDSRDTNKEVLYQYRKKQIKTLFFLGILIVTTILGLQNSNKASDIMTTPLSYYLQQNNHAINATVASKARIVSFVLGLVLVLVLYICHLDSAAFKLPFKQKKDENKKYSKLLSEMTSFGTIIWVIILFVLFNLLFYQKDIEKFIARQKITTEQVGIPESKIEYRGPDLQNPDDPPFPFSPHQTVAGMAREAGLSVERLQLYSLMWAVYKNDEPLKSKFPNAKERFYELEKHHYRIVCKEKISCVSYINRIAPINRSLITLKVAILKDALSLNVAKEYFNNSNNIDILSKEPLIRMRDVVQVWANEIERKGMENTAVEVPMILYHLNIEPTVENLTLFEQYIKLLDETPLNPKISIGFLKQAIDTDPNLRIPIPRNEIELKRLRHT